MSKLYFLVILIVIGLIGTYGYVQSGLFNVAATENDGPLLTWLLNTTMENSVETRASKIVVPELGGSDMMLAGISDYIGMCAQCHGEPGRSPGAVQQGLNPAPPELDDLVQGATPAEMFWIITNGIRMTGMPAFGKTHTADEIWPVVAFLQAARNFTEADYDRLKLESRGHGHHTEAVENGDHDSHHHNQAGIETVPETTVMEHHHEPGAAEQDHSIEQDTSQSEFHGQTHDDID